MNCVFRQLHSDSVFDMNKSKVVKHIKCGKHLRLYFAFEPPVCIYSNSKNIQECPNEELKSMRAYFSLQLFPDSYCVPSDLVLVLVFSVQ